MSQNNDGVKGYNDPTLGFAPELNDDFLEQYGNEGQAGNSGGVNFDNEDAGMPGSGLEAGNEDLFDDLLPIPRTSAASPLLNTSAEELGAPDPQSSLCFPQVDSVINQAVFGEASSNVEASQSLQGQLPLPSSVLPEPDLSSESPQTQLLSPSSVLPKPDPIQAHHNPAPGGSQVLQAPENPDQGHTKVPEQNPAGVSQNQVPVPFLPSSGQDNKGVNQAVAGQGMYGNQFQYNPAYGNPIYPAPPAPHMGQFGGFPNMFAQPAQNFVPGYPWNTLQAMPNALDTRSQGYPTAFAPSMFGLGVPGLPGAQLHMLNQPANLPPLNQPVAAGQGHPLNGMKMNHKRNRRGSPSNDPNQFYAAPIGLLRPWGPKVSVGKNQQEEHLFRYYQQTAELRPSLTYSREQLVAFFLGHGHPYPGRRLTLWIQNTPAQINERYANRSESSKCRYRDCPAKQNTILKGFFRVAFDEFSDQTGTVRDPFRNAGYMHLHCFESLFDLGYLIHYGAARHNFQILPDRRSFIHESRNPASLSRDHGEMIEAYDAWVESQKDRADRLEQSNASRLPGQEYTGFDPAPQLILPHAQRLGCTLTDKHLTLQVKGRAATRESRGGIHIGIHKGDLDLFVRLHHEKKGHGGTVEQAFTAMPSQQGHGAGAATLARDRRKKWARDEDDEDSDDEEGSSMSSDSSRSSRRARRSKRRRALNDPGPSGTQLDVRPRIVGRKRGLDELDDTLTFSGPKRPQHDHISSSSRKDKKVAKPAPLLLSSLLPPPPSPAFPNTASRDRVHEAGNNTVDQFGPQTRQSHLGHQRTYAQPQALMGVPEEYATLVLPPSGTIHDDRLAERIARLNQRQRREVEQVVERLERKRNTDKRKCLSL